eukprot:4502806-Alexandrium_andersonii.AAC.1
MAELARDMGVACYELDRPAYGLKDAVLMWRSVLDDALVRELDWRKSALDPSRYYHYDRVQGDAKIGPVKDGAMSAHVDDVLTCGKDKVLADLQTGL